MYIFHELKHENDKNLKNTSQVPFRDKMYTISKNKNILVCLRKAFFLSKGGPLMPMNELLILSKLMTYILISDGIRLFQENGSLTNNHISQGFDSIIILIKHFCSYQNI
jgi:hypothetical protein